MIDIIDLIPSKDMREALRESGRRFTDMEKATIIANLRLAKQRERELLQALLAETDDDRLRQQLRYGLQAEQRLIDRFRDEAADHVFGVQVYDDEFPDDDSIQAYFATFDVAHRFGIAQKLPFCIRKWEVRKSIPEESPLVFGNRDNIDGDCGMMKFDAEGELVMVGLWDASDDEVQRWPNILYGEWPLYLFYESRWIDLPDLYEQGDIVRVLKSFDAYINPAYDWAVVSTDRAEWEAQSQRIKAWLAEAEADGGDAERVLADYSDMQIMMETPCKDGTFRHDHVNPMFLERVTEDAKGEEAELQQMASWAAKGECGLEWISTVLKRRILAAQVRPDDFDF